MNKGGVSIYLVAPLLSWFLAHSIKFVREAVKSGGKKLNFLAFFRAGGMPSAHSAVMIATLTVIGFREGVDSATFGLALVVTAIVINDAINVRRSVGEQGDFLRHLKDKLDVKKGFFTAYGHTGPEVLVGGALGLLIGVALLQIL